MGIKDKIAPVPKVKGIGKRSVSGGRATKKIARAMQSGEQKFDVDEKLVEKYRVTRQADKKKNLYQQLKLQNKDAKRARRTARKLERKALGKDAPVKQVPKTKERLRKPDVTIVDDVRDAEILADEADDEFAKYFDTSGPKTRNAQVLITTSQKPHFRTKLFCKELLTLIPNSTYRPRKDYTVEEIVSFCSNRGYTNVIVIAERLKAPFQMIMTHLPEGPTATFRISNFLPTKEIENVGEKTKHYPELNLKNFDTRLGRRVARLLESLFPTKRDYAGRSIVTFHSQRDYIFCRTHRYIFEGMKEVTIQELGPRFTLRLYSLQKGTFDSRNGEFEWIRKKKHDQNNLEWFL